jgi:tripartite-type tricarboxylate transporter receptor subunit TctC
MLEAVRSAAIVTLFALGADAFAQDYPVRPVRLVVPSSPGGTSDFLGRLLAPKLAEALGQQFIVENRPGASSMIGAEFVAKAAPDGYTLLISPAALAINPSMYATIPFDARRDLAPISLVTETGNVLVVHPSVPVRSVKELISIAKTRPGSLVSASPGIGGSPHMSVELFKIMAGIDVLVVTYKGAGPGVIALLSGEVSLMFTTPPSALAHVKSGRLRALGVTTRSRIQALQDVPTIHEAALPGYEASQWFGLLAPARTPRPIIDRLYRETRRAMDAADMKRRFSVEGLEPVGSKPEEFGAFIHAELGKWAKVIKSSGLRPQGGNP